MRGFQAEAGPGLADDLYLRGVYKPCPSLSTAPKNINLTLVCADPCTRSQVPFPPPLGRPAVPDPVTIPLRRVRARGSGMSGEINRARAAERREHSAAYTASRCQGGASPALPPVPAPMGASGEVGDTAVRVVRVSGVDNDLLQEFEKLLEQHFNQYPELAASLWREIEGYLTKKIVELERRKQRLRRLRDKVRTIRMLYEVTPKPPGGPMSPTCRTPSPRGAPTSAPRDPSRGRECSVKDY